MLNNIGDRPHVVFPGTSVIIHHVGRKPVLADRNFAIFYNAGDDYDRRLHDPRGDHCVFVALEPRCFGELAGGSGVTFTHAPGDVRAYLAQSTVVRGLRAGWGDPLFVEETVLEIVRRSLDLGLRHHGARTGRRRGTDQRHHELVESARVALAESPTSRTSLEELARRLHVSAFHLARIFKARTGFTPHSYRNQLRLRLALDRIHEDGCDLAALAFELGFSSHSHFTDAFRALFGAPPSAARAAGSRGRRELRKNVEAQLERRA
jgi:AraC-like DNA-binding protein